MIKREGEISLPIFSIVKYIKTNDKGAYIQKYGHTGGNEND